jgi:hypothetical protein
MRVARGLRESGAIVRPAFHFTDVVTGLVRETDVVAEFAWDEQLHQTPNLPCSLTAIVECKSSRKQPWVAFRGEGPRAAADELQQWFSWAYAPYTPVTERLPNLWIGEEPFTEARPASHVVAAKFGDREKTTDGKEPNPAHDAVRQVLSAAAAMRKEYLDRQGLEKRGLFVIPVIVTAARLFNCWLDDDAVAQLEPTERIDVWGYGSDGTRARVYVMNEGALAQFGQHLRLQAMRAGGG